MEIRKLKKIAVFTSGGDAPGMIDDDFRSLDYHDVSGIIQNGGTILKTARCKEFRTEEGRKKAYANLKKHGIEGVVVIGGDGSFRGATKFISEFDIPFVGIPGTIDNDISGTDYTLGYDTALNTVMSAVDKIKDTASSHGRIFFVEAMGREAGLLALKAGIACGAEVILIPEVLHQEDDLNRFIEKGMHDKRTSGIVMVAEGDEMGGALKIAEKVKAEYPEIEARVSILGHIQRGGNPTAQDRVAATRMGMAAVHCLMEGKNDVMVGLLNDEIVFVPFKDTGKAHLPIKEEYIKIQKELNTL